MKAYIFHGWGGSSKENWFPWLGSELMKREYSVIVPDFPDSQFPNQNKWLSSALRLKYDEHTLLVGHSLGSVLIMRVLEKIHVKIKSAYLVAAFDRNLGIPEIDNFFLAPFDYRKIRKNAGKLFILNSDNDPYITDDIPRQMSERLGCRLKTFHDAGHLSNGTGNLAFPELRDMILNENNQDN